jgi:hypothetical protein
MQDEISLQPFTGNLESEKGFLFYDAQKQCVSELFCCDDGKMKVIWTSDRASKLALDSETYVATHR